jgi:hypothetical protein
MLRGSLLRHLSMLTALTLVTGCNLQSTTLQSVTTALSTPTPAPSTASLSPTANPTATPAHTPTPTPSTTPSATPTPSGSIGHGLGPTITTFTPSGPIVATSGQVISGLSISNPNGACITLTGVTNVTITNNQIGPCGATSAGVGIDAYNSDHLTVQNNNFNDVASGLYATNSANGNILFSNNYATNIRGPFPRGQIAQFNNVSGAANKILCNVSDQVLGGTTINGVYSGPEDHINMYMSNGTSTSPIEVAYNKLRGGGSPSGGGIMAGDTGGSYEYVHDNILVNPGQYGIAIAGGSNIQLIANQVFAVQNTWTNIGGYVWEQGNVSCSNNTFQGNLINFTNAAGSESGYWDGGGCGTVAGESSNTTNDTALTANIWNTVISQCQ